MALRTLDWRDYSIKTSSLWLEERGDFNLKPKDFGLPDFHGRYHPEIPFQMIRRYVTDGRVWDCFAGGGTTIDVGKLLDVEVIANDILPQRDDIIAADSCSWKPAEFVQLVMLHPPYWNMVKFSDSPIDLCSAGSAAEFCARMASVIGNAWAVLEDQGHACLVISDIYRESEQWPLGAMLYTHFAQVGFRLRGKIVKDFGETKGSAATNARNKNLWRYRKIKLGLWDLGLDEIWVYQKRKQ